MLSIDILAEQVKQKLDEWNNSKEKGNKAAKRMIIDLRER